MSDREVIQSKPLFGGISLDTIIKITGFLILAIGMYVDHKLTEETVKDNKELIVLKADLDEFEELKEDFEDLVLKIEELESNKASNSDLESVEIRQRRKIEDEKVYRARHEDKFDKLLESHYKLKYTR